MCINWRPLFFFPIVSIINDELLWKPCSRFSRICITAQPSNSSCSAVGTLGAFWRWWNHIKVETDGCGVNCVFELESYLWLIFFTSFHDLIFLIRQCICRFTGFIFREWDGNCFPFLIKFVQLWCYSVGIFSVGSRSWMPLLL